VGQQIQQAVRTLPHVANPLVEVAQQRLAPELLPLVVEHDPLELSARRHFAFAQPAYERVALPAWKAVAAVEHETRRRNRRHPEDDRLLETGRGRRKARAVVVAAVADDRPAVVVARLQHVQFVAAVRTVFLFPDLAGERIESKPKLHAMTDRENRRLVAALSDERIVGRHAAVIFQAQDLAGQIVGVLGAVDADVRSGSDRKSTRLNSSHVKISYAVFCLKKKKKPTYLCLKSMGGRDDGRKPPCPFSFSRPWHARARRTLTSSAELHLPHVYIPALTATWS